MRSVSLVQVDPSFVPMQFNTALGMLVGGIALVLLGFGRYAPARACAAVSGLLGLATLTEYAFALDLGIDQLFLDPYITVQTSHPGRMAPNTALSFVLSGAAVMIATWRRWPRGRLLLSELMGSLAVALGLLSVIGYLIGVEVAYGWGSMTRMAVHTGAGFVVLGMGIFAFSWTEGAAEGPETSHWVALPLGLAIAVVTVVLWRGLISEERARLAQAVEFQADNLALQVTELLQPRLEALERMAARWEARQETPREEWEADAARHTRDPKDYLSIFWVAPTFAVRWSVAPKEDDRIAASPIPGGLLARARARRRVAAAVGPTSSGETSLYSAVPLYREERLEGYIVGVTSIPRMVGPAARMAARRGYTVDLWDGDTEIIQFGDDERDEAGRVFLAERRAGAGDVRWRVRVWPAAELLGRGDSPLPEAVLVMGLLMAVLLPATVKLAVGREYRADLFHRANFDPLTGLPNRALAADRFIQAGARARRNGQHVALLFLDLDGFKAVNDGLGHLMGDRVLREVADRLATTLRESDTVARLGGDEFLVLLPDLPTRSILEPVCARILSAFAAPFEVAGQHHRLTASIGIALFPDDGDTLEVLLRFADAAMYRAKAEGGNRYFVRNGDGQAARRRRSQGSTIPPCAEEGRSVASDPSPRARSSTG